MSRGPFTSVQNDFALRVRLERRALEALAIVGEAPAPMGATADAPPCDEHLLEAAAGWAERAPAAGRFQVALRDDSWLLLDDESTPVLASRVSVGRFSSFTLTRDGHALEPGAARTIVLIHVLEELDDANATALLEACWVALAPAGKLIAVGVTERRGLRARFQQRSRAERRPRRPWNHGSALRRQGFTIVSHEVSGRTGTPCELAVGIRLGRVADSEFLQDG